VGYEGYAWQDERSMATAFAGHAGIPVHELRLSVDDVVRGYADMCLLRDEPVAEMTGLSWFALGGLARSHGVNVLLTGSGGDELFWGYPWLSQAVLATRRKKRLLNGGAPTREYMRLRRPPLSLAGLAWWAEDGAGLVRGIHDRRRDQGAPHDQIVFWDDRQEYRDADALLPIVAGPALRAATASPAALFRGERFWSDLETSMVALNCATYLRSHGLLLSDRLLMATGVEGRAPLVDYQFAQTVIGLRKGRSDFALGQKAWFKAAVADLLPAFVIQRRKRGFTPPWRTWTRALMARHGRDMADGILVERGVLDRRATDRFRAGFDRLGRPMPLAQTTLDLELWARGMAALAGTRRVEEVA
jgi:asparagine synthase (glutamine-hydrolysing)